MPERTSVLEMSANCSIHGVDICIVKEDYRSTTTEGVEMQKLWQWFFLFVITGLVLIGLSIPVLLFLVLVKNVFGS